MKDENYKKSKEKAEEIFIKENLKKNKNQLKESGIQWHTFKLLFVYLGLFVLIMEVDFLPKWLVIPIMIMPLAVEIIVRLHTQEISFYEAIKESKISIIFCVFFLIFGILCLK